MKYFLVIFFSYICIIANDSVLFDEIEWQDNKESKMVQKSWEEAKAYCTDLSLLGKNDWRLPTIKELQNIVNIRRKKPAIDVVFHYTANKTYWTRTPYRHNSKKAWSINFYRGYTKSALKKETYYVRCKRSR